ncbi:class I SAM-dependent methyltransferase [Sinorhizobium sp. BG8]|uniref:class I SAM-dependent methyltransferase n=1 Tax=Sinorhizobium sp. BG8 TaxID=2613773 RepID=UPI00193D858D|nr:class I SAM-dependent methyltransferase [Sinorhizobium sp. BG8]QRM54634.1 class I SAM-dependent methyltransferase [Sinorhizobium sp. BG8]
MLVTVDECLPALRCPRTKTELRRIDAEKLSSAQAADGNSEEYRIVGGKPILIDFSDSVLSEEAVFKTSAESPIERASYGGVKAGIKRLLSPRKAGTRENVRRMIADIEKRPKPVRLLVVGGGSVGQGMEPIYDHPDIKVYGFDVYSTPHVQFIADAHHMPLADDFFDVVIIQAVLEHVLQPAQVVAEIWRVLRPDGLVYAETPFMQQVHEGAFDFTRFTESGHRYLFRNFERISSGASGGPGIQFMWSADYLARSLFRSVKAGKVAKLLFFWTQYLDRLIPQPYAQDGASGVYFYGRKAQEPITPRAIISHYQGAQRGKH